MFPFEPTRPDETWGVLGPTKCPVCRMLRKDPVFIVLWGGLLAGAVVLMFRSGGANG